MVAEEKSKKCVSQSEARAAIFNDRSTQENTELVEDPGYLLHVKFRQNPFSGFREEVENVKS